MDVNELAKLLGLRDFAEVEFDSMKRAVASEETHGRVLAVASRRRQSGRTTRMLLEAFLEATKGSYVSYVVHSPEERARIERILRGWEAQLPHDIRHGLRTPYVVVSNPHMFYAGSMGIQKFYDHYVIDPTT